MNTPLRTLIVDDEPPARRALAQLLREMDDVEVTAMASNGLEALDALSENRGIELVLLDIEMPVLAGMALAARLHPAITPALVFVTAWPRYATGAFDVGAVDYLLKPVDPRRLQLAVERARQQLRTHSCQQRIATLEAAMLGLRAQLHPVGIDHAGIDHVWVELTRGRQRLALDEIEWFAADGDYVQAHTAARSYLMRDSLNRLESALPASRFVRVHRSTIVNIAAVTRIVSASNGQLLLSTQSGATLTVGRRARSQVSRVLGG